MSDHQHLHGRGILLTDAEDNEIPVFYTMMVEHEGDEGGAPQLAITGRIGIDDDPWLEALAVREGSTLVLDDGRRLKVDIGESGRSATTLPFTARPLDESEFLP